MRGNCKSMAFALNVSVLYLAYVAYKNLPVNPLKHDIKKKYIALIQFIHHSKPSPLQRQYC